MHNLQNLCSNRSKNDHRTHLHKMWRTGKNSPENLWNTRTNYPQTENITNNSLPHWDKQVNTMVTWGLPPLGPPPTLYRKKWPATDTVVINRKLEITTENTVQSGQPQDKAPMGQVLHPRRYLAIVMAWSSPGIDPLTNPLQQTQSGHNCSREVVDGS